VMYRGRILAIVSPDLPREEIGLLMAGITGDAPAADPPAAPQEEPAATQEEPAASNEEEDPQ
jgi:hypothetical protein